MDVGRREGAEERSRRNSALLLYWRLLGDCWAAAAGDRLFMDFVTIAQRRRGTKKKKLVELTSYCLCRRRRPSREQSIQGFKDLLSFLPFCTNYSFSSCSFFFF